jgi:toxin ParE1/3/4
MRVRWTRGALANLDAITSYIAQRNPSRAASFSQELRDKVAVLEHQLIGHAGRVFGTKEYVLHPNYIAIYRVKDGEVQLLRIQHAAKHS